MNEIAIVAGARPNFMKIDPLTRALQRRTIPFQLVHTGQHYDQNMSDIFFEELEIVKPNAHLEVGSGSHAQQTAQIMIRFEEYCLEHRPSCVVVAGDVNSTIACSLVAAKLSIPVAHLEAGLRSHDWSMPEEVNRVLTDRLSNLLFTPSRDADQNLLNEGIESEKILFVGNIMIDSLNRLLPKAKSSKIHEEIGLIPKEYLFGTFHRPSNVDEESSLLELCKMIEQACEFATFVLPLHPRTKSTLLKYKLLSRLEALPSLKLCEPVGYIDCLALSSNARAVLTDSGGLQEETTVLGVPCLTIRPNTERPVTIEIGTNELIGLNATRATQALDKIFTGGWKQGEIPEFWDGATGERCVDPLLQVVS